MNKAGISQVISQIDFNYIQEAMEADKVLLNGKGKEKQVWRFYKANRLAACVCMALLMTSLVTITAFAASETFREAIISVLYPIYSSEEIKALDNGNMTGSFDEQDTLLSFLDRFNAEKMELGVLAENNEGYTYSLLSNSPDSILAIVQCNISNYKILVSMERLDYESTTGIWQVVSYQMITSEADSEVLESIPEYVPAVNTNPEDSIIETEGTCAVIYNANNKDNIVPLTEQESSQIEEILEGYTETTNITAMGLQDMVIKYEDVMYAFSEEGDVLVMDVDGGKVSVPRAQIKLSTEDLETLLNIFSNYGV